MDCLYALQRLRLKAPETTGRSSRRSHVRKSNRRPGRLGIAQTAANALSHLVRRAPRPSFREVRPSTGYLRRQYLSPKVLRLDKKSHWPRFYLTHLHYALRKHDPELLKKVGLWDFSPRSALLLGRSAVYFRLMLKLFPKNIFRPEFRMQKGGHTTRPFTPKGAGYLSEELTSRRFWPSFSRKPGRMKR